MNAPPRIVVLTGAGVSADSGVSTFRDPDGIWSKHDWREVATPEGFAADPALVHSFYNARRASLKAVAPNAAHLALARLEALLGAGLTLVTQNVDDLHERAGSVHVIHMHGELMKAACAVCGARHRWTGDLSVETRCPDCKAAAGMRPDVVWFGEIPRRMDEIAAAIAGADLFVSIGTSGSVYPASGFVAEARSIGVPCTELNLEPSENASAFGDRRYGRAAEIVPAWVEEIARGRACQRTN
ncbi:MAG TPA: NAD-dependent protein deacylase [Parvularcula sp.]|nr:NAD-dependent protein deacylase [Parvularcula sp.]HBS30273.1 NAD-dependent protein deacylase [Parvularcula sp.]HBS36022.1 NAD-dependent protein deacylase [Parvularcula sp.]